MKKTLLTVSLFNRIKRVFLLVTLISICLSTIAYAKAKIANKAKSKIADVESNNNPLAQYSISIAIQISHEGTR